MAQLPALAFGDEVEEVEEFGEANGGGFCTLDYGFTFGAEGRDAECHGDAVVTTGVDDGSVELLTPGDVKTIFKFFDFGAHGAEIACDEGDAIGFLDAEFLGVANANAAAGVGADGSEYRELIDKLGGEGTADFGGAEAGFVGGDLHGAYEF